MNNKVWGLCAEKNDGLQDDPIRRYCGGRPQILTATFPQRATRKIRYINPSKYIHLLRCKSDSKCNIVTKKFVQCKECNGPFKVRRASPNEKVERKFSLEKKSLEVFEDADNYWQVQVAKSREEAFNLQEIYENWLYGVRPPAKKPTVWQKVPHHYRHHKEVTQEPKLKENRVPLYSCADCTDPFTGLRFKTPPHKYNPVLLALGNPELIPPDKKKETVLSDRVRVRVGSGPFPSGVAPRTLHRLIAKFTPSYKRHNFIENKENQWEKVGWADFKRNEDVDPLSDSTSLSTVEKQN